MATFREIQAKFSASAQGMKSTINSVTRDLRGMQKDTSTASQVMTRGFDNTGRSVEKFRSQVFELEKRTDSQAKSVESARAEYDKMVDTYGENSKEAARAGQALDTQIASHKDLQLNLQNTQDEFSRFNHEIETQSTLAYRMGDGFESFSTTLGGISETARNVGSSLTKYITLPVAGVIASAAGITAAFGWNRLASLDTAQAQLRGLGYETEDVERITENLVGALDGGMMTMADATFAAANAMAAGVEEGDELTKYIQMLDAAVVGGNGTFEEMQQIFSRVADEGTLTRREFEMMADRMPGFSQAVGDFAGASGDALYEMLNNGEITLDDFLQIMEDHGGDMAKEYAKTWRGMVENTKNYVGILGETMLEGVFEDSKLALAEFIELLKSDEVVDWARKVGIALGDAFARIVTWVKSAIDWFMNLDTSTQKLIGSVAGFAVAIGPILLGLGTLGGVIARVSGGLGVFLKWLAPIGKRLGLLSFTLADGTKKVGLLARAFGLLGGPVGWIITAVTTLAGVFIYAYNNSEPFKNFIDGLVQSFKDGINWIKDFGKAISGIWSGDTFSQDGAMDLLYQLGLSEEQVAMVFDVVERIKGAYEGMKEKASENLEMIKQFFIDRFDQIKNWWDSTGSGIFDSLVETFGRVKDDVSNALSGIKDFFIGIFQDIQSWWASDGELIFDAVGTVFEGMQRRGERAWSILSKAVEIGIDIITGLIETFAPIVEGIFNVLWPTIVYLTQTAWEKIKLAIGIAMDLIMGIISGVSALIEGDWERFGEILKETAESIWNRVVEFFGNMKDNALELINDLTGGAIDKFIEMRDGVIEWVLNLIEKALFEWQRLKIHTELAIRTMVHNVKQFFIDLWNRVTETVSNIRDGVVDRFTQLKDRVVEKVDEIFGPTIKTFQDIYNAVSSKVEEIRVTLTEIWSRIRTIITSIVKTIYNRVKDWFLRIFNNVDERTRGTRNRVTELWRSLRDRVVNTVRNLYNRVRDWFLNIYNNIRDRVISIRNTAVNWFTRMRDTVVSRVRTLYNRVSGWFSDIYTAIHNKMRDAKNKAVGFATDLYTGAKEQFEELVTAARDMMDGIGDWIDDKRQAVVNKAKNLGRGIANAAIDGFNGLIKGINWVARKLGAKEIKLISKIGGGSSVFTGPGYSAIRASKGLKNHKGGDVLVGDKGPGNTIGGGSSTREIVQLPDGKNFLMDGNVMLRNAPKGLRVHSNKDTEAILANNPDMNPDLVGGSGTMSKINSWLGRKIGSGTAKAVGTYQDVNRSVATGLAKTTVTGVGLYEDIMDYADNPMKLFTDILDKYVGFDLPEYPLELATRGIGYLKDKAVDTFKKWFEDFGSGGDGSHILGKKIYQRFGKYTGGIGFNGGKHYGIDTAHKFDPLLSPVNGKVTRVWRDFGGGNSLQITTDKYIWWFMHLSRIIKKVGDRVKAGMRLGTTGNTGNFVVGSGHLHTQVHPRSKGAGNHNAIDPLPILRSLKGAGASVRNTTAKLGGYFKGGITSGFPELAWLNEEGFRESIISHNPAHRERSHDIWSATGQSLGFGDNKEELALLREEIGLLKQIVKNTGDTADNTDVMKDKEPMGIGEFEKLRNKHLNKRML